jgi:hypothetical protein
MLDTASNPPQASPRHVRDTLSAHIIGAIGLVLAALCLAVLVGTIVFWSALTVIQENAAERRRQIEVEGWTPEHGDQHPDNELMRAAVRYDALINGLLARKHQTPAVDVAGRPLTDQPRGLAVLRAVALGVLSRGLESLLHPAVRPADEEVTVELNGVGGGCGRQQDVGLVHRPTRAPAHHQRHRGGLHRFSHRPHTGLNRAAMLPASKLRAQRMG